MKNCKWREHISCVLYMIAFFVFLGGITAENRGNMLDFTNLARNLCSGLAVVCVIAGACIWKAKDARAKKIKISIMVGSLLVIAVGGIIDRKTDNTSAMEHHYIHKTYKGEVIKHENSELTIIDYGGANNEVSFFIGEETLEVPTDLSIGDEVIIESEYWTYSKQPYPAILVSKTNTTDKDEVIYDLSNTGELTISEFIEKNKVFVSTMSVRTNTEEITIKNNSDEDLTIYLYCNGEVIRQMSLAVGNTKTVDGLNGALAYEVGVIIENSVQVDLLITD